MLEGLLLEVLCKEELERTITYDFMYISMVLGFFWATLYMDRTLYLTSCQLGPGMKMNNTLYLTSKCLKYHVSSSHHK